MIEDTISIKVRLRTRVVEGEQEWPIQARVMEALQGIANKHREDVGILEVLSVGPVIGGGK